jgi:hypothetical protein
MRGDLRWGAAGGGGGGVAVVRGGRCCGCGRVRVWPCWRRDRRLDGVLHRGTLFYHPHSGGEFASFVCRPAWEIRWWFDLTAGSTEEDKCTDLRFGSLVPRPFKVNTVIIQCACETIRWNGLLSHGDGANLRWKGILSLGRALGSEVPMGCTGLDGVTLWRVKAYRGWPWGRSSGAVRFGKPVQLRANPERSRNAGEFAQCVKPA